MWHIVDTPEHGVEMVYLVPVRDNGTMHGVTLMAASLGTEQWSLIKRQFDNMGIVPRFAPSHDKA
jgi:hypothetical protein